MSPSLHSDDQTPIVPFSTDAKLPLCCVRAQTGWYNGMDPTRRCYRHHAALITTDVHPVIKEKGRVETALRAAGYVEPVIVPLPADTCNFDRTVPSLADAIEQVRASECLHVCRGCAAPLLPSQTCGSSCRRCSEEAAELHRLGEFKDRRALYAFLAGVVLCGVAVVVLLKVLGWRS